MQSRGNQRGIPQIRVLALVAVACCLLPVSSQVVSEYQVKAAYLYNFAKFVEWPERAFPAPAAPLHFCVLGGEEVRSELEHLVHGKLIAGRPVDVISIAGAEQSGSCHILFVNSSRGGQVRQVLEVLRGSSVLTVGESQGFVEAGGIINFVLQDDRVQFQVNQKAATQAGLHISSRLLSVAKLVIK